MIDKPAGMMVHAGSGQTDDARSRGTLVNALLHRFQSLSSGSGAGSGELRPGIVHRLDKDTSGLIIVAKNDRTHAALAALFSGRQIRKTYIALVHGAVERQKGTITAAIGRDPVRRTRMSTRMQENARSAVSHYEVVRRLETRFRQIHPGPGAHRDRPHPPDPRSHGLDRPSGGWRYPLRRRGPASRSDAIAHQAAVQDSEKVRLGRNFLHAAELEFTHPITGKPLLLKSPLPEALESFVQRLETPTA